MIKVYLEGFASPYEGEDIEVRYAVFEDETHLSTESVWMEYRKPALAASAALLMVMKRLSQFRGMEIVILMNDPAMQELIRGTSTNRDKAVIRMAQDVRRELSRAENVTVRDVSLDRVALLNWNEALKAKRD